jgi:hypothetical protein
VAVVAAVDPHVAVGTQHLTIPHLLDMSLLLVDPSADKSLNSSAWQHMPRTASAIFMFPASRRTSLYILFSNKRAEHTYE